ncbi:MAG: hypothetical protein ABIF10_06420 [Candidatus Woesearchaeota archaeon]
MAKNMMAKVGVYAFMAGLILAVLIALFAASNPPAWGFLVLAVMGLIVGFLNVSDKEVQMFLIATIGFMVSLSVMGTMIDKLAFGWKAVSVFFGLVSVFIAPTALVVAIKALFNLARD